MTIKPQIRSALKKICGDEHVLRESQDLEKYSKDKTGLQYFPDLVVLPRSTEEISQIMTLCYAHDLPLTPMGRATGLGGNALPVCGGILLSMEKFNRILFLDENNYQITVEPYVTNHAIRMAAAEKGLFYPPDPVSSRICSIGGNIAVGAGGPKAVKYGCTKDYVLTLEVVLPNGDIINTGKNVLKDATGYNLTQLFIGSEGTLGIITKATLRLLTLPTEDALMLVSYRNAQDACASINTILGTGIVPSSLEFINRTCLLYARGFYKGAAAAISDETEAHVIIELDGSSQDLLKKDQEVIKKILLEKHDVEHIEIADTKEDKKRLWVLRRNIYPAIHKMVIQEMDIVVPRFSMADVIVRLEKIAQSHDFHIAAFGHAGDGNLHVAVMVKEGYNADTVERGIIASLDAVCNEYSGQISGEHGIGSVHKPHIHLAYGKNELRLMKAIKQACDPKGLLNPEKIF